MTVNLKLNELVSGIKNSAKQNRGQVLISKNNFNKEILNCLYRNGIISSFTFSDDRLFFIVSLKLKNLPELSNLRIVSSSSRRIYMSFKQISKNYKNTDFFIVSTSKGIFFTNEVFFLGLGGVILFDNLSYN